MDEMDALFGGGDDSENEYLATLVKPEEGAPSQSISKKNSLAASLNSENVEIMESMAGVGGGRGLRAKRDIPAGTLILSEIPSISFENMNATKNEANSLSGKYDMANAIEAIVKSNTAYQCAKHLFPKQLSDIDGAEVMKMKEFLSVQGENEDADMAQEREDKNANLYELLVNDMRQLNRSKLPDQQFYKYIHEVTEHEILRLALVLQHNCFGSGLYRYISIINHSCMPNCIKFAPTAASLGASEIYATRGIAQGEEITINYCFPCESSYKSAKDYLMDNHTFECTCPRCGALREPEPANLDGAETETVGNLIVTGGKNIQTAFATARGTTISVAEKKAAAALAAASAAVKLELEKEEANEELLGFIEEAESRVVDVINPPADAVVTWGETSKTCKDFMVQALQKCAEVLRLDVTNLKEAGLLSGTSSSSASTKSDNAESNHTAAAPIALADLSKLFVASLMCMDQTREVLQASGVSVGAAIFKHKLRYTTISLLTRLCHVALRAGHVLVDHYFEQLNNPKLSAARLFEQKQKVEIVLLQMVSVSVISMYLQTKAHILLGKWVHSSNKETAPSSCCQHPDMITTYVDLVSSMECVISLQGKYRAPADCTARELGSLSVMYSLLQPSTSSVIAVSEKQQAADASYLSVFSAVTSASLSTQATSSSSEADKVRELCKLFTTESKRLKKLYNTMLNYNRPRPIPAGSTTGSSKPIVQVLRGPGDIFWG